MNGCDAVCAGQGRGCVSRSPRPTGGGGWGSPGGAEHEPAGAWGAEEETSDPDKTQSPQGPSPFAMLSEARPINRIQMAVVENKISAAWSL